MSASKPGPGARQGSLPWRFGGPGKPKLIRALAVDRNLALEHRYGSYFLIFISVAARLGSQDGRPQQQVVGRDHVMRIGKQQRLLLVLLVLLILTVSLAACENENSTPTPQKPNSPLPTQPTSPTQPPSPLTGPAGIPPCT
jgi:hypothetical protein